MWQLIGLGSMVILWISATLYLAFFTSKRKNNGYYGKYKDYQNQTKNKPKLQRMLNSKSINRLENMGKDSKDTNKDE